MESDQGQKLNNTVWLIVQSEAVEKRFTTLDSLILLDIW